MTPEQKQYIEAQKQNTTLFQKIFPRPMMRGSEEYKRWQELFMPTPARPHKEQQEAQPCEPEVDVVVIMPKEEHTEMDQIAVIHAMKKRLLSR